MSLPIVKECPIDYVMQCSFGSQAMSLPVVEEVSDEYVIW